MTSWGHSEFGPMDPASLIRVAIPSATALATGLQVLFGSFFLAMLGIPAVWLVDLTGRELTACEQPAGDGYLRKRVVTDLAAVELPGLSDLTVDLSTLF